MGWGGRVGFLGVNVPGFPCERSPLHTLGDCGGGQPCRRQKDADLAAQRQAEAALLAQLAAKDAALNAAAEERGKLLESLQGVQGEPGGPLFMVWGGTPYDICHGILFVHVCVLSSNNAVCSIRNK